MQRFNLCALAAVALCAAVPSWATSTASASLSSFSVSLIDLDTTDGIDPSITFDNYTDTYTYTYVKYSYRPAPGSAYTSQFASDSQYIDGAWTPVASNATIDGATAHVAVTGSGGPDGSTLSASGQASSRVPVPSESHIAQFDADVTPVDEYWYFTLSANTQVVFGATASVAAEVDRTWDPVSLHGRESAHARVTLMVSEASVFGVEWTEDELYVSVLPHKVFDDTYGLGYYYTGDSLSDARQLSVSYLNLTDGTLDGRVWLNANAGGSSTAAVPEPESYVLMIAGLAVVGGLARRRTA